MNDTTLNYGDDEMSPSSDDLSNTSPTELPMRFTGSTAEYFGIWMSNLLLSIVTLGIYSAWAKVRRKQYFYNNTLLASSPFAYHATGWQILKGRLVVVAALIILNITGSFAPVIYVVLIIALFFAIPALINKSLQFNAHYTSYRNVRFRFTSDYWDAFIAYNIMPLISILSLGLLAPVAANYLYRYIWENVSYGGKPIKPSFTIGQFYKAFFFGVVVPGFVLIPVFSFIATLVATSMGVDIAQAMGSSVIFSIIIAFYLYLFLVGFVFKLFCIPVLFNGLSVDNKVTFHNTINPFNLLWIVISNFFAIIFTLGLLIPWAQIRRQRYVVDNISTTITTDFDEFIAESEQYQASLGEEFADFEGVDLGL